ncbi:MAG: hypothetical protein GXP32_06780 [Kiritimatiellaeota bacterium]|nr:hypothetical protein [Kiritimatiellota bacterium]
MKWTNELLSPKAMLTLGFRRRGDTAVVKASFGRMDGQSVEFSLENESPAALAENLFNLIAKHSGESPSFLNIALEANRFISEFTLFNRHEMLPEAFGSIAAARALRPKDERIALKLKK